MKKNRKDIFVIGLALFAMFFGAGNLIFPTFLGLESGTNWTIGFSGFVLADVGLALLSILAVAKCDGDISKIFSKAGKKLALILGVIVMVCLGPLLAIPRTAATTFEMGINPIFNNFNPILFSVIFFLITMVLSIRPSKVVDIIGKFLTPILFIALLMLIVIGIINPIDSITIGSRINNVFAEGVIQGYQTMDALGAIALSTIILSSLSNKGYKNSKDKVKLTFKASIIASIGLIIVYGGLAYLGATLSNQFRDIPLNEISQAALIVKITFALLGSPGKLMLAVIIGFACLTTSIGLTSAVAQYFSKLSNRKLKYETIVIIICVFSCVASNFGVSTIIKFSAPILSIIYPPTIILVILNLFEEKITNRNIYIFTTYVTLLISILTVLNDIGVNIAFINNLPFAKLGFNWIVPALIAGILGKFIPSKNIFN